MKQITHCASVSPLLTFVIAFSFGAIGYYSLEIAFRGFSHWSMAICGGLCAWLILLENRRFSKRPLVLRALVGALIITAVEFTAGCLINLYLGWGVWDYSSLPWNLLGQISPAFSVLWFLLCLPICFTFSVADRSFVRMRAKKAE